MARERNTEYAKAVAKAEHESRFYVATTLKATVPEYVLELDRRISELQIAWRDMSPEEKNALIKETIQKAKRFVRPAVPVPHKAHGDTVHIDPIERSRQLEALYATMTVEQRAEYDERMEGHSFTGVTNVTA